MKKLRLFCALMIGLFACQLQAQNFTVTQCSTGIGSNVYGPMNSVTTANSKNRTAFILPASQLLGIADGTITSTYFRRFATTGTLPAGTTFKIYLKNTTASDFPTAPNWDTETGTATLVYNSDPAAAVGSTDGFKEFEHATNFVYTSGSNLAVFVEYVQTTGPATTITWDYEYGAPCISTSNSNTTRYQNTTGTFAATLATANYRRPVVAFDVTLPAATAAPACTTLTAPANAATGVSLTPTFTWSGVFGPNGAWDYLINLGTTPGGTNTLNQFSAGNATSYSLPTAAALLYNTTYYVTVIPTNNMGNATGCTETSFTTLNIPCPTVTSPAAAATGASLMPTINWNAVTGATGYYLTVGTSAGATDVLNNQNVGNITSYTFASTLTPGTQYFYTVTATDGTNTSSGCTERNFTTGSATPPANDNCANAVMLPVSAATTCTAGTAGNTLGATQSQIAAPCFGNPDDDVWYSFVATGTSHIVTLSNVIATGTSTSVDTYFQVLSGTCGASTSLLCSDPNTGTVSGLTAGQTYFIRVYSYGGTGSNQSFEICVSTPPAPPANDDCAAAVTLTVNPDFSCTAFTAGTTVAATASTETAPSCAASGTNDDVWYKFTATNAAHRVALNNVSGSTDMAMAAYSGVCGSLVQVTCSDPNVMDLTGLTPGAEYTVRVWTLTSTSTTRASFEICVGTPPPPPANDDCSAAVVLTPSSTGMCATPVSGSTASASASTGTTPTCSATGINDDVWYSFTATSTTHLVNVIYSDNATTTQVYSGACGSLTAEACFAGNYGNSNVLLSTLTVGQTYYVRVFSTTNTASTTSNFTICITTPEVPANDSCSTAIAIAPNGSVTGNNALATPDTLPTSTCGSTGSTASYNGVWYTVTSQVSGPITISACGTQFDAYMRVYTGDCSTLTCVANTSGVGYADAGCSGNNNAPTVTFNATAGTTYYVLLTGYSATQLGYYTISTSGTLGTSNVVAEEDKVAVYPNPFTDFVNISDVKDLKALTVVDMSGRLVKTIANPGRQVNLSELKSGVYILKLDYKDGTSKTVKAIRK